MHNRHRRQHHRLLAIAAMVAMATTALLVPGSPAGAVTATATATATAAAACDGSWQQVPSPNPGSDRDVLFDVAALAGDDAWAVGHTADLDGRVRPLTLHWDGTAWQPVPTPVAIDAILSGVTMIAPDDVWAVGYVAVELVETRMLALHWDGTAWERVPVPRTRFANLTSVSGTGPDDVWAVGMDRSFDPAMITLHWDGTAFTEVPSPPADDTDFVALQDVVAVARNNAWAVGYRVDANGFNVPLSIHWNGRRWSRVAVPDTSTEGAALEGVTVTDTGQVWAVGRTTGNAGEAPLALRRFDGAWTSPHPPFGEAARFEGVAPLPGGGLVAVGFTRGGLGNVRAIAEVYTGDGWKVTTPAQVRGDDFLFDVATVPGKGVSWAVGNVRPGEFPETLIERRCV